MAPGYRFPGPTSNTHAVELLPYPHCQMKGESDILVLGPRSLKWPNCHFIVSLGWCLSLCTSWSGG